MQPAALRRGQSIRAIFSVSRSLRIDAGRTGLKYPGYMAAQVRTMNSAGSVGAFRISFPVHLVNMIYLPVMAG